MGRDRDGTLKCFYKDIPVRHILLGRWECKPVTKREYFTIPFEDEMNEHKSLSWSDEPREVRLLVTNRRILWR